MILALLLAQAAAPTTPVAPQPQDIEVVGRHLSRLRLALDLDGADLTACRVTVSSGDGFIDAQACPAASACVARANLNRAFLLACIDRRIAAAVAAHDGGPLRTR